MSNYCTVCGAMLHENDKFCNGCGRPLTSFEQAPKAAPTPAPTPAPAAAPISPASDLEKPVGIWAYIGCMLLWSIPVVGLIAGIVMAAACQKKSLRNFSLAVLIFKIVTVIISMLVGLVFGLVMSDVIIEIAENITNPGYAALFSIFA